MPRYKLTLEYDGTPFCGWQFQENAPSVQQTLEEAMEKFAGHPVRLFVAGRTDTGVHACGQVAHGDFEKEFSPQTVKNATNFHLGYGAGVTVLTCERVSEDFHARFDAKKRFYQYRILNRESPPVLDQYRVWHVRPPLDIERMQAGADYLVGRHDFTTFRTVRCQSQSPLKTIDSIHVTRQGEMIFVDLQATSFLHHQVRNIMGTLQLVGSGAWDPIDVQEALLAKDRSRGGPTAPPQGLYLMRVSY